MAQRVVPPGGGEQERQPERPTLDIIQRDLPFLQMLVEAGGFMGVRPIDPSMIKPGTLGWMTHVYPPPKILYYNPETERNFPGDPDMIRGLLVHELGHHHLFNLRVQKDGMGRDLQSPPLLPEYYDDNSFIVHLHYGLADIVDEAVMGRYPYAPLKALLAHFNGRVQLNVEATVDMMRQAMGDEAMKPQQLAKLLPVALTALYSKPEDMGAVGEAAEGYVEKALSEEPSGDMAEHAKGELGGILSDVEAAVANWDGTLTPRQRKIRDAIRSAVVGHLKQSPKPEQYVQMLLSEGRYPTKIPLEERVEPDVLEAYRRTMQKRQDMYAQSRQGPQPNATALEVLQDVWFLVEGHLRPEEYENQAFRYKMDAYRDVFRAEYLKLVEAEIQARGKARQEGQARGGLGEGAGYGSSVPLTKEERQRLIEELRRQIREGKLQLGEGKGTPIPLSGKDLEEIAKALKEELDRLGEKYKSLSQRDEEARRRMGEESKGERPPREPDWWERMRGLMEGLMDEAMASRSRGLGAKLGVDPVIVQEYFEIRRRYAGLIRETTDELVEVFRDNRLAVLFYNLREGEITPGLEAEYLGSLKAGDLEPDVMMEHRENPDFAKTEILHTTDVSGSMGGAKIQAAREAQVVMAEAIEGARDRLRGEAMLRPEEEVPLKMASVMWDVKPEPIHHMQDPWDERSKIELVRRLHEVGGGTDDYSSIKPDYDKFRTGDPQVIKLMFIYSDGYGDKEKMAVFMEQIRQDGTIIVCSLGFGSDAETIANIYGDIARRNGATNVYAEPFPELDTERAVRFAVKCLTEQVPPRVREMTAKWRGY